MCGLVLLLPHGYEGMGPEHSSARLERFLELCAKNNLQVAYPTTPAQLFHVLRRQIHRNFRKPLILMTPKSLLRNKQCVSPIEEFIEGSFRVVIDDDEVADPAEVRRVLLCTGKIYYDLLNARREREQRAVALVRLEQLYPFPERELRAVLERYPDTQEIFWVQEEAQNMGAWNFVHSRVKALIPAEFELFYVGRDEAASPAAGSFQIHQAEQQEIVERAMEMGEKEVVLTATGSSDHRAV